METAGRVVIYNLNPGEVRHEFLISCLNLVVQDSQNEKYIAGIFPRIAGGNLGIHRNECVEHFVNQLPFECEWMLFLDSDLQVGADTLTKLFKVASPSSPIVAGLYVNVSTDGLIIPMVYDYRPGEGNNFHPWNGDEIKKMLDDGETIAECDGVGAGCLLIHRSVIDQMVDKYGWPMPCFGNDIVFNEGKGVVNGEDFTFCLRAKELNIPIVTILDVDLIHVKPHGITREHLFQFAKEEQ